MRLVLLNFAFSLFCLAQNQNLRLHTNHTFQPPHPIHRSSFLPTCVAVHDAFKSGAHPHQAELIRDLVQIEGQKIRKLIYWRELLHALENPGAIEAAKKLYFEKLHATLQLSNEEIKLNGNRAAEVVDAAKAKVDSAIDKAIESTPALSPFDHNKIRACAYGRSNPHLYEGRPKVSMMLQFFKRPWAIQTHIDKVMECQVRSSSQSASEAS